MNRSMISCGIGADFSRPGSSGWRPTSTLVSNASIANASFLNTLWVTSKLERLKLSTRRDHRHGADHLRDRRDASPAAQHDQRGRWHTLERGDLDRQPRLRRPVRAGLYGRHALGRRCPVQSARLSRGEWLRSPDLHAQSRGGSNLGDYQRQLDDYPRGHSPSPPGHQRRARDAAVGGQSRHHQLGDGGRPAKLDTVHHHQHRRRVHRRPPGANPLDVVPLSGIRGDHPLARPSASATITLGLNAPPTSPSSSTRAHW